MTPLFQRAAPAMLLAMSLAGQATPATTPQATAPTQTTPATQTPATQTPATQTPATQTSPAQAPGTRTAAPVAATKTMPATPPAGQVEASPITCAWRTSKGAVEVGERFTLTVTCALVETDRNTVVVEPSQFDASAVSLVPFEVVGGRRHEDVVEAPYRHFQYEFVVRMLSNSAFGQDVDLPPLSIKYTIRSSIGGTEGRELTYVLPALPMRVLSLVSTKASDIRDTTTEAFRELEARRRRANNELAFAAIAFAFAAVLVVLALARVFQSYRSRTAKGVRPIAPATLVRGSVRNLQHLNDEVVREGWTLDRVARALAALRVPAAIALGRTVAQTRVDADTPVREGQVSLRTGFTGFTGLPGLGSAQRAMASAATSAAVIERSVPNRKNAKLSAVLDELRESLQTFTAVRYGRSRDLDTASLNAALEKGMKAARQVRTANRWPGILSKAAAMAGVLAWMR